MAEYTSETGKFVILNVDGRVVGKADVGPGTHPVSDEVDAEKSFDVRENGNEHVAEYLEYSPANKDLDPSGYEPTELFEQIQIDTPDGVAEGAEDDVSDEE
ncbi:hypothetical protein [Natronorubrum sulfidifaciens]|uniref:Uncharacterized protein n=1 Tax=Natronorubrum sulfidifaciens JCM 14089 TaxID=1230460 RepID=L9WD59_9EURY|nr:hypothetical protein [Natronorubrum sulfidifaciens]ELY47292.1 hypothetical protein C495_03502 [Natronorubrum sulfidifaciens JCM 14089]